jgi:hypothetical protein
MRRSYPFAFGFEDDTCSLFVLYKSERIFYDAPSWFYEQTSANFAEKLFERARISNQIVIRQLEYPGDAKWPYPASAPWAKGRQKP